jgi:hypothetical protein
MYLKEQLLNIRERKKAIPIVPDPKIVVSFNELKKIKKRAYMKKKL